jgi:hypothetical protein
MQQPGRAGFVGDVSGTAKTARVSAYRFAGPHRRVVATQTAHPHHWAMPDSTSFFNCFHSTTPSTRATAIAHAVKMAFDINVLLL